MVAADGSAVGRVTFVEAGGRVAMEARFTNLPPGFHGFHVHAVGKCERSSPPSRPPAATWWSVSRLIRSTPATSLSSWWLADRTAEIRLTTDRYKLSDLLTAEGRAVIVHANPDSYANVPARYVREPDAATKSTGDAGDRIACGVVGGGGATTTTPAAAGATTTSTRQGVTTSIGTVATLDCQTVGFTPNSEDAASSIKATGLTCAEAEAFVRIAGRQTSSGGPAQVDLEGYRCIRVRSSEDPLPQAFMSAPTAPGRSPSSVPDGAPAAATGWRPTLPAGSGGDAVMASRAPAARPPVSEIAMEQDAPASARGVLR